MTTTSQPNSGFGILANASSLRRYRPPAPYWPARQHPRSASAEEKAPDLRQDFASKVELLQARGYLDRDFGEPCVLWDQNDPDYPITGDLAGELRSRLASPDPAVKLWPLRPETWDEDTLHGLIEVLHDLVARPRTLYCCEQEGCGAHGEDFDTDAGRRVYRALVNELLAKHASEYQLATAGEDTGRLVHVTDQARADLVAQVLQTPDKGVAGRVEHAISQLRRRGATEHDKRAAVITLAGVLEERRELISKELGRKDEGALFRIANEFAIRHQGRGQQGDYDPAFLDWMGWWYLSTIELTDRIVARQAAQQTEW